ncbi:hypothetical protein [Jannaschia formosa]|uniref:hypothetical protein n=1 Tax=Jannaschia formosa TaxID=2259592 RepID=UPI000E1BEF67|nr:hypothetical protein [Jannaschia formosa]TFL17921.1 hypothetical protein DR046_12210 [Jannaschia formosa]
MNYIYTTLTALAVFTLAAVGPTVQTHAATQTLDVGTQSGTYSGEVRGFWFTAPTDFWITGIDVPTDASTGTMDVAILRLPSVPPTYASTTTTFNILFEALDEASAIDGLSIGIATGDIIGVLGYRGGVNSYRTGPYASDIFGNSVQLNRFGTQNTLDGGVAGLPVWSESGGSISRVFLEMSDIAPTASPIPVPASLPLVLGGFGALLVLRRRRRAA